MKQKAAVIGAPISHSLSPEIFSFLAQELGLPDLEYRALEVAPASLASFVEGARKDPSFAGFNVTLPHKRAILPHLDGLSPEARAIGAVNVVWIKGGRAEGSNTDVRGVLDAFEVALGGKPLPLEGLEAVIFGAGGAAAAVAYAFGLRRAASVRIWNRTADAAGALASRIAPLFPATRFLATDLRDLPSGSVSAWIQATPVGTRGMAGSAGTETDPAALLGEILRNERPQSEAVAFDLVYNPAVTPFLAQARASGLHPLGGLPMLVGQALETWKIWFGPLPKDRREVAVKLELRLGELLKRKDSRND